MKSWHFAGDFEWTRAFLVSDRDKVKYITGGNLSILAFHAIQNTCRLSELFALQWWRRIMSAYGAFYSLNQLRKRNILVALNGLIDGMGVFG